MRVEKTYIAKDGKRFKDQQECIKYEYGLLEKVVQEKIVFFGEDYAIMSGDLQNILETCKYLYIFPDVENIKELRDILYYEFGFSVPKKSGYWAYDDDVDKWVSIETKIKILKKWEDVKNFLSQNMKN